MDRRNGVVKSVCIYISISRSTRFLFFDSHLALNVNQEDSEKREKEEETENEDQ